MIECEYIIGYYIVREHNSITFQQLFMHMRVHYSLQENLTKFKRK